MNNSNNISENDILNNKKYLNDLDSFLKIRQFSEEFLVSATNNYDPMTCLKYQKNLSPYFCFKYLYDNDSGYADNWVSYNDVTHYLSKQEKKYTDEEIEFFYNKVQSGIEN